MAEAPPLVAVLAAGRATRFGGGKLDADCVGKPLGSWVLDTVVEAGLEPGDIVIGPDFPAFTNAAEGWTLLVNPHADDGLGSSVSKAVTNAFFKQRDILLLLADMPLVSAAHLKALVRCETSAATKYPDGAVGVPVCLRGFHVERVYDRIDEENGAASILRDLEGLTLIEADPQTLLDVDTSHDLAKVAGILAVRQG